MKVNTKEDSMVIIKKIREMWKFIKDIIPKWSTLAKIQRFKVIRLMYIWLFIVPILAKAFTNVDETVNLTIFEHIFNIQLVLPFSWKAFFYSALLFTVANLIFMWKCYNLVKDHNSFSDFREQGKSGKHIHQYAYQVDYTKESDLSYYWVEDKREGHPVEC